MKEKKTIPILKLDDQIIYFKSSEDMSELDSDKDISLIVTSPPYWKIKDYKKLEQIGREPYPDLFSMPDCEQILLCS